ncbi:MAG: sulfatase [Planctomycetes bacterium]|nr:sulfatase [Planctomycetota bacterium]
MTRLAWAGLLLLEAWAAPPGFAAPTPPAAPDVAETTDGAAPARRPPNVLFVSLDTLRADHLGAYGYRRDTSPHLDALAAEGALFEDCIAVSDWTLPTHASLFTGLDPTVHGVQLPSDSLARGVLTLGEAFAGAGYETAGCHSNPFLDERFGFARGFSTWRGSATRESALVELAGEPKGSVSGVRPTQPGLREHDYLVQRAAPQVTEFGLEFLDAHAADDAPFLLFLHYNDAHSDYIPPAPYDRMFDTGYRGPIDGEDYSHDERVRPDMDPDALAYIVSLYDGEIAAEDAQLGRVLDRLDALGLRDDTLVVVTADHGEGFFERGENEHRYGPYHELVHVPWIVRLPGDVPAGLRVATTVSQIDVAPTLLDLAGVEGAERMDGRSHARALRAGREPPARPVLSQSVVDLDRTDRPREIWALRHAGRAVIVSEDRGRVARLSVFDREADPDELQPAADGDPAWTAGPLLLERLRATLRERAPRGDRAGRPALPDDEELLERMRQWGYLH